VIAGDRIAGEKFLNRLEPFIWRKSLDFYAIQDIHSIKRQIYATKGGERIDILGHNIKLGRGGIREIEFYVQIQQLIWGGRLQEVRCSMRSKKLKAFDTQISANSDRAFVTSWRSQNVKISHIPICNAAIAFCVLR
jgi:glutamine synthetase adenylyltransferase